MSNHNSKPEHEETPEERLNRQLNNANSTISYQEAEIKKKKQKVNELEEKNQNLINDYIRIQNIKYQTEKENRRLIDEKRNDQLAESGCGPLSADHKGRMQPARLGRAGLCVRCGRSLCRPSVLRTRDYLARSGEGRV